MAAAVCSQDATTVLVRWLFFSTAEPCSVHLGLAYRQAAGRASRCFQEPLTSKFYFGSLSRSCVGTVFHATKGVNQGSSHDRKALSTLPLGLTVTGGDIHQISLRFETGVCKDSMALYEIAPRHER